MTQRVVLRALPERIGPLCVAASYQASDAHATVGGDLYAAARITGATRILIGDVRGKGPQGIPEAEGTAACAPETAPHTGAGPPAPRPAGPRQPRRVDCREGTLNT